MTIDIKAAALRLAARKTEIETQTTLSDEDRQTVALDQQSVGRLSRMDALQRQAMAQAQERARTRELARIEQALRRLHSGDYGYCDECGEAIALKRLEVDPSAHLCIDCAGRAEHG